MSALNGSSKFEVGAPSFPKWYRPNPLILVLRETRSQTCNFVPTHC